MKVYQLIIAAFLIAGTGCIKHKKEESQNRSSMLLDSLYEQDKSVTVVKPKDEIYLSEVTDSIENYTNISKADIDALNKTTSKEVQYVNKGDEIRLSEK